jgi:hypothetical protein
LNNSKIPVNYKLRIENEKNQPQNEFEVTPSQGLISELDSAYFEVTFNATKIQKYNFSLVVYVDELGSDAIRLPIKATSCIPEVYTLKF